MDDETAEEYSRGHKWRWSLLLVHLFSLTSNILTDFARFWAGLAQDMAGHYNYQSDRQEMHEQAAREIERLTEGEG